MKNLVFTNWETADLSENQFASFMFGLDFGFTNDPSALVKCSVKDGKVYILDEVYQKGLTNDKIASAIKGIVGEYIVSCDSSEPKSIAELKQHGISAVPVRKGKDSVQHGIQWLRQNRIIIDKKCQNFINEIQTYKYREDRDGNVMNDPIDMANHLLDALRYACEPLMSRHILSVPKFSAGDLGL